MNPIHWLKQHKNVAIILLVIVALILWKNSRQMPLGPGGSSYDMGSSAPSFMGMAEIGSSRKTAMDSFVPQPNQVAPSSSTKRLKTYSASLSMVVENVSESLSSIEQIASRAGGFLIESRLSSPQEGAYGTVSLRVSSEQLQPTLEAIKQLGVRVTQESITSADLTDEYEDIDAKLSSLQSTMTKFEAILDQADTVEESMRVQEQLLNLQDRIDSLVGRKQYMEKSAELSLLTITIASDELSLPYAPSNSWRPALVFKQAVRSLVQSARTLANFAIWIGVYSVIWIPLLLGVLLYAKRRNKKLINKPN
jgi:hypothetical protein